MTVFLRTQGQIEEALRSRQWCAIDCSPTGLDPQLRHPTALEDRQKLTGGLADQWFEIARQLASSPGASLAHMPACAANASDFWEMLKWSALVEQWAAAPEERLVVCRDPWLYRHLAGLAGVRGARPPGIWWRRAGLGIRGYAARSKVALKAAAAWFRLRGTRNRHPRNASVILVYGHPRSDEQGYDGYFSDLMSRIPNVVRLLHVDCGTGRAQELAGDGRTFSLHAWGDIKTLIRLPFVKWRPGPADCQGRWVWLVRRAAAVEGRTGQSAMIRWQQSCQRNWLERETPISVAWPWENHAWERTFVGAAKRRGVKTIGYQHATVGKFELNYSPRSDPEEHQHLPDQIACSGRAWLERLEGLGVPAGRMSVCGSLRNFLETPLNYSPDGPVFVALPYDRTIAQAMVEAIRPLAGGGQKFVVKDHPMTPFVFDESDSVVRTTHSLQDQSGLSGVLYAATSVGLESLLGGLPTYRFETWSADGMDVVPDGFHMPAVSPMSLADALDRPEQPPKIDRAYVFDKPDYSYWSTALSGVT